MRILAIDVGKASSGAAFAKDGKINSSFTFSFKAHDQYYKQILALIDKCKPELIGTAKPNRFYNTIYSHAQMIALIELAAEHRDLSVFLLHDREIKSWAFPKQKKVSKAEVRKKYGGKTNDEADARMFAMFLDAKVVTG